MLNIKVIDFGLATRVTEESTEIHQLSTLAGTPQFQPPEIIERKTYDGKQADMFSIGVILFMMVFKSYPFRIANSQDRLYKMIIDNT